MTCASLGHEATFLFAVGKSCQFEQRTSAC